MYPKPTHQKSTHQKSTHFGWGIEDNRNTGSYLFEFHWDFSSVIQFSFILVEPGEAGNIGAAARAMNTMGYTDLRLVRPQADHLSGIAKAFAHGSEHILEAAPVYEDLKDAIADIDLACATTARHRLQKYHYASVRDLPDALQQKGDLLQRVAIVFGSERSGLSNSDVDLCDLITNIPQVRPQPSLNLSQAVMVYSFTLAQQHTQVQIKDQRISSEAMPPAQYAQLKTALVQLLNKVGVHQRHQRYVEKALARLGYEDLYLLQSIRAFVENKINALEQKTRE
ncbi:MAG: tRNA/rRNA methyltransferase [Phormidesmis priestleyi Ana]|uniref:tRNA/rRNA methyltransferase n=1 Tax=Phormidesmis priestleyi Ana TaxID=1666911 RepID=A0A0N8KMJ5_9CYAN|nr:MAG: tRNA/rRNA methyltransferase [Phormidesmis priestleyi Ana]